MKVLNLAYGFRGLEFIIEGQSHGGKLRTSTSLFKPSGTPSLTRPHHLSNPSQTVLLIGNQVFKHMNLFSFKLPHSTLLSLYGS